MGTFYGHGSSIALVVFFALVAMRAFSSQRRRRGHSRGSAPSSSFADTTSRDQEADAVGESGQVTFTGIAPGWLIDPSGRHERRYWSGSQWTEHVTDGGVPGIDPPPPGTGSEPPS